MKALQRLLKPRRIRDHEQRIAALEQQVRGLQQQMKAHVHRSNQPGAHAVTGQAMRQEEESVMPLPRAREPENFAATDQPGDYFSR